MERLKLFKNHQYQELHDSHLESHDHNVDQCHEKESSNTGNRLEVPIVNNDYKPTIDGYLSSNNEENNFINNNLQSSNRIFLSQDGNYKSNMVQVAEKSGIEELNKPHKKETHHMQEVSYDFLRKTNLDSWEEKTQVERKTKFDESHKKVLHRVQEVSYDFFEDNNLDSWKTKTEIEKEIDQKGKHFQFNVHGDVFPSKLIENIPQFQHETLDEQSYNECTSSNSNSNSFGIGNCNNYFKHIELAMHTPSNKTSRKCFLNKKIEEDEDPFYDADLPENININKWTWIICCEWLVILILISGLIYTVIDPQLRESQMWGLELWRWMVLVFIIVCGRLLSNWLVRIIIYLIERFFLLKKKVLYFVYALKSDVRNCIWLTFVLLTWNTLFDIDIQDGTNILAYVSKVLQCFLIAATLIVIKTFFVKILASSFHMDTYFERIRDSLFNQYVLETLSGPPIYKIQVGLHNNFTNLHHEEDVASHPIDNIESISSKPYDFKNCNELKNNNGVVINVDRLYKTSQNNLSPWSMKKLINLIKNYEITTLIENFDKDILNDDDSTSETKLTKEYKAKIAAKRIFKNVVKPGCKFITEEDLMCFMNKEEASRAILLFNGAIESKKIFPKSLKNYVINVYKERRALASSLSDTKTAVNKLHGIINIFLSILVIILWLLILGIATTKFIVFILSQLLVVVFIFGNTCRNTFEAIIFLFVVHPFDIGDRCVIDGQQLIVEEMNILTTIFLGELNAKIWYPNSLLATKPIQNFYRSPEMSESFEFFVHSSTSGEKIAHLKDLISKYIASKPEHWKSSFNMLIIDLDNAGKMKLSLNLTHTMNYQDFEEKISRRSDLLWEMKKNLEALSIEYHLPSLKVHIQNLDTSSNKIL